MLKIKTTCPICKKVNYVEVNAVGFMRWQEEGVCIQNALPELSADEREMLKTGICPTCWDKMFEGEEEDDDPDCDCEWVEEDSDYDYEAAEEGLPREDLDEIANMMAFQKAYAQRLDNIKGLAILLPR